MKIFLDTANIEEIKELMPTGLIDGITTNPSLISLHNKDFYELIAEICELCNGPISAEVISTDLDGMVKEGKELSKIHKNVVVKLPSTIDGISACTILTNIGIKTNVTLCFSPSQALMAAKAGATYISPIIGRLDDIGSDGLSLIDKIKTIYNNFDFKTEILAASIRSVEHVVQSAMLGANIATLPTKIFKQLFNHPLTDKGLEIFLLDWKKKNI